MKILKKLIQEIGYLNHEHSYVDYDKVEWSDEYEEELLTLLEEHFIQNENSN